MAKRKKRKEGRRKEGKERKKDEKGTTSRTPYIKHAQQMTYMYVLQSVALMCRIYTYQLTSL